MNLNISGSVVQLLLKKHQEKISSREGHVVEVKISTSAAQRPSVPTLSIQHGLSILRVSRSIGDINS
jgi:hypothetical protein